jgi:branched-chain amino acid transport system ATP-binding protein
MLEVQEIDVYYGKLRALQQISFSVEEHEIVTIIGSNGAGKTTTLKAVCGLLKPRTGTVLFQGKSVGSLAAYLHAKMGISYVPEGGRVFNKLTVEENLEMGGFVKKDAPRSEKNRQTVYGMFPILQERRRNLAGILSGGERQMLSIGRALMSDPDLLLLDEPSLGLAPFIVKEIYAKIQEIRGKGVTILLVEQNVKKALEVANRGYVYAVGRISLAGSASELSSNEQVRKTFLGDERQ